MTDFQNKVLELVSKIPRGKVVTYKQIAEALGKPRAYRVVGNAVGSNPRPVEIPCHRVVRSDGRVGGYRLGRDKKKALLRSEGIIVEDDSVDLKKYLYEGF